MIFFIILLLIITFVGAKIAKPGTFMEDYLSRDKTMAIKGLFVLLVFLSHSSQYIGLKGTYDAPYLLIQGLLGQMVVAMFFFYSGYGMMEATIKKRFDYIKTIPKKRFPVVFLNFAVAVILFLILNFVLGKTFDIKTILLSFIGWTSVGNSNWYMFAIFGLYILMFVAFVWLKWNDKPIMLYVCNMIMTILTMLFIYWEIRMGQPKYFYDTMILFPLGCWYSLLKKPIEKAMMKNDYLYSVLCVLLGGMAFVGFTERKSGIEMSTVWAVGFTLCVVAFTMKISIKNEILCWFGKHIFSVYILQRIPMIVFSKMGISSHHRYEFVIMSLLCTIVLALVFDYCMDKLIRKLPL